MNLLDFPTIFHPSALDVSTYQSDDKSPVSLLCVCDCLQAGVGVGDTLVNSHNEFQVCFAALLICHFSSDVLCVHNHSGMLFNRSYRQ